MVARVKTDRAESTGGAWESVIENYAHLLGYSEIGKATMEQLMSHHINGTGVQEGMFAADDEKSQMGYAAKARVPNRNNEGKPRYADFRVVSCWQGDAFRRSALQVAAFGGHRRPQVRSRRARRETCGYTVRVRARWWWCFQRLATNHSGWDR